MAQPLPAEASAPVDPGSTQGRSISVRTLGQGVPFNRQAVQVQQPSATPAPHQPGGSGAAPQAGYAARPGRRAPGTVGTPASVGRTAARRGAARRPSSSPRAGRRGQEQPSPAGGQPRRAPVTEGAGRSYAIGAPDKNAAEGPEPLDGPGGAVEVADPPRPQPMDDELPPEPLDNPRRLLVWPAPDVSTQQALSDRGYRPVIVHSREEVDAQIAAFPAALFVDPLTGPITRTALQSLRQAAVAAEVPVLVTARARTGLARCRLRRRPGRTAEGARAPGQRAAPAARAADRGARGDRAGADRDAGAARDAGGAGGERRRRGDAGRAVPAEPGRDGPDAGAARAGRVRRDHRLAARERAAQPHPLVVYTAAVDQADLPRLASGETVLFLAERSTSGEVQSRIVELLSRIGTN
ncbi:hypothetical protein LV779_38330 [Streptomyces thinghirensis]|nr:hypothetical protein [Streptomyces thinghirensis]